MATKQETTNEIKVDPKAIDPDDPELLEDMVLAAVNEALRSAQSLAQSKLGAMTGGHAVQMAKAAGMYKKAKQPEQAADIYLDLARSYPQSDEAAPAAFAGLLSLRGELAGFRSECGSHRVSSANRVDTVRSRNVAIAMEKITTTTPWAEARP